MKKATEDLEEQSLKKFLDFNGKKVYFLSKDGVWWIAIKPICDALGVNYDRQFKNLKSDKFLSQLYAIQHIVAADNKLRQMICLPEVYLYGWLLKINSDNPELLEYQWKCYIVLYNYFHSYATNRMKLLREKTEIEMQMEEALKQLEETPAYQKVQELKAKHTKVKTGMRQSDTEAINTQLELWRSEKNPIMSA